MGGSFPAPGVREIAKSLPAPGPATRPPADALAATPARGGHVPMGGSRAQYVHDRRVIVSSKRTSNRKLSPLTVAGSTIAVAAIASGAAASAATVAPDATGQATTTTARIATVPNDHARFSKTDRRFSDPPAAYTVKPGDSLSAITRRVFGHADRWPRRYATHVNDVGADPEQSTPREALTT